MTGNTLSKTRFIGFDHLLKELDRLSLYPNESYPPHNVIKINDSTTLIELALAGFNKTEISIELKDNILTISGDKNQCYENAAYVHKGISTKQFSKSFKLSEYTEVTGATFIDGILSVSISVKVPEEKVSRVIPIDTEKSSVNTK
jgi:molecular chaperone IbpA